MSHHAADLIYTDLGQPFFTDFVSKYERHNRGITVEVVPNRRGVTSIRVLVNDQDTYDVFFFGQKSHPVLEVSRLEPENLIDIVRNNVGVPIAF